MFAIFHCWIPGPLGRQLPQDLKIILEGENYDELAWDLVEAFFDAVIRQAPWLCQKQLSRLYPAVEPQALHLSLSHTLGYHQARFTPAWWERQEWRFITRMGASNLGKMKIGQFQSLFPPDLLLELYLTELIGGYYAPHHGEPDSPLTGRSAIEYLIRHRYIRLTQPTDPELMRVRTRA